MTRSLRARAAGNARETPAFGLAGSTSAETGLARADDSLCAGADTQLGEDGRHVVARSALADMEPCADVTVVDALSDQFQHLVLTHREVIKQRISGAGALDGCRQKIINRLNELAPRRFGVQQHVAAAFKRDKPRAGYEPCDRPALLEWNY